MKFFFSLEVSENKEKSDFFLKVSHGRGSSLSSDMALGLGLYGGAGAARAQGLAASLTRTFSSPIATPDSGSLAGNFSPSAS